LTTVNSRISAEDVDDAATFSSDSSAFDARWAARTTARVDWDNIGAWTLNTDYNSPDIKTVIQEIVDRAGWASGNDIVIFWDDFDDRSTHNTSRWRLAYSYTTPASAPKLYIEWTIPAAVTTGEVTGNETEQLTANGNVTAAGDPAISRRGFCYKSGASGDPTTADSTVYEDESGTGAYSLDITGLNPATAYRVRSYVLQDGSPVYGSTVQAYTIPVAPTDVAATQDDPAKVTITWSKPTGATGYLVKRDGVDISGWLGDVDTYDDEDITITPGDAVASQGRYGTAVRLSLSGFDSGVDTHEYTVTAKNAGGESEESNSAVGTLYNPKIAYQWQRSAGDSDADYTNITGGIAPVYYDTAAPVSPNRRYYRCSITVLAETETSTAARGWRKSVDAPRNTAQIIIRNPDGETLAYTPEASDISQETAINQLGNLTFRLPSGSRGCDYLEFPNEAWLYKDTELDYIYKIVKPETTSQGYIDVECIGMGYTLMKDVLPEAYTKTISDGVYADTALQAILNYQEEERVTIGDVSPMLLTSPVSVSIPAGTTLWDACLEIQKTLGGYLSIVVDASTPTTRKLNYDYLINNNHGQQIRTGKNLISVTQHDDYLQVANRVMPVGNSGLMLDTVTVTREAPEISEDATYGYITIPGDYSAYDGFTGAGDALPATFTVEKPTGAWTELDSHDTPTYWEQAEKAYSGAVGGATRWRATAGWLEWFTMNIAATNCNQVRWNNVLEQLSTGAAQGMLTQVEVYYSGGWHQIWNRSVLTTGYIYAYFAEQSITAVRMRFYKTDSTLNLLFLNGIRVWETTGMADDTANWQQGANETQIRIPIASFTEDVGYLISYTRSKYLVYLDEITSGGVTDRAKIFTKVVEIDTTDEDALLLRGRRELAAGQTEHSSIDIEMVDLSVEEGREFEELSLGNTMRVIDADSGIDQSKALVRIVRPDLMMPARVELEMLNKTKDILDVINE